VVAKEDAHMSRMMTALERLQRLDNGQDLLEYGLLAALIAIVAMAGVSALGGTIYNVFWRNIGQAL
jgi:Flp pilus assembly pilin Flp